MCLVQFLETWFLLCSPCCNCSLVYTERVAGQLGLLQRETLSQKLKKGGAGGGERIGLRTGKESYQSSLTFFYTKN